MLRVVVFLQKRELILDTYGWLDASRISVIDKDGWRVPHPRQQKPKEAISYFGQSSRLQRR